MDTTRAALFVAIALLRSITDLKPKAHLTLAGLWGLKHEALRDLHQHRNQRSQSQHSAYAAGDLRR